MSRPAGLGAVMVAIYGTRPPWKRAPFPPSPTRIALDAAWRASVERALNTAASAAGGGKGDGTP